MSSINIGNISQIKSTALLISSLSSLSASIQEILKSVESHKTLLNYNYSVTFRFDAGTVGYSQLFTLPVSSHKDNDSLSIYNFNTSLPDNLRKLGLTELNGFPIIAQLADNSLEEQLQAMTADTLTIPGSQIHFRAKHKIKPIQPGKPNYNDWTPLSKKVSIVVTRMPITVSDVHQADLDTLNSLIDHSSLLVLDTDGNIVFKE